MLLADAARLTVLRVWKSYRRCQLSWLAHASLDQPAGIACRTVGLTALAGGLSPCACAVWGRCVVECQATHEAMLAERQQRLCTLNK